MATLARIEMVYGRFLKIVGWIELTTAVQAGREHTRKGHHVVLISMVADETGGNHLAHFVHRKAPVPVGP
jgi:hypothetical protein